MPRIYLGCKKNISPRCTDNNCRKWGDFMFDKNNNQNKNQQNNQNKNQQNNQNKNQQNNQNKQDRDY